jgi:type I restriction enzyme S subunit
MSAELKPGYKQTEVGVIPEDWEVRPVSTFGDVVTGGTPPTAEKSFWHGDYPWVTPTDISNRRDIYTSERCISASGLKTLRALPANSVLVTCIASIGKNAILKAHGACNQQINAVIPNKNHVAEFLYYVFENNKAHLLANAGITATSIVSKSVFTDLLFPLPPTKAEQEVIAEALSDADALIESLEQLIAKKRHIKQGAMQDLLTGKKRLPGFSGEWERKRLGYVANIQRGASPRPIESPIWFDINSSIGWVRISDVTRSGIYLYETTQCLSALGVQHSRPVSRGNLIMSICATVGRPIITEIDTCIHDGFVVFENLRIDKYFLYYILKSIELDWSKRGQTGSQMNLNTGLINRTEIAIPSTTKEQTAIAAILSDMDAEIAALEAKLAKARQIKQGMMQELLTGKTRLV